MTKPLLYAYLLLSAFCVLLSTNLSAQTAPPCFSDTTKPFFEICPASIVVNQVSATSNCMNVQWVTPVAYDNCGVASLISSANNGFCFPVGLTNVVYTATDSSGNTATCLFSVTVRPVVNNPCATDTVKPRFTTCPASIVLTTRDTCITTQWIAPIVFENCGTPVITSTHLSGTCFPLGITTVVYTATDARNNVGTCSFWITINDGRDIPCATDTTKPVFTNCPANIVIVSADSCARATWAIVKATDNCSTPTISSVYLPGACFRLGTTVVEYNATDAKLNRSYCTFSITVNRPITINPCATDTVKPRFVACPTNIILTTLDTCARAQWAAPAALDNCSTPSVISNYQSGACFGIGTTTVGYSAVDSAGNKAYCTFTVTVNRLTVNPCANDTTKPRFVNCPANIILTTLDTCARVQLPIPTAYDNCGIPSVVSDLPSGFCFRIGTTNTTYIATDSAGNKGYCTFTVTVNKLTSICANDTTKPRFLTCPTNIILSTLDSCARAQWVVPTALDNCGVASVVSNYQSSACFRIGTTTIDYSAVDSAGNRAYCTFTVTVNRLTTNLCVNDTIKPRFERCPTNIVLTTLDTCARAEWLAPLAYDNCSTPSVISSLSSGFCFKLGTTTVTYIATDSSGNKNYCSFTVTVNRPITTSVCANDTTKPRFERCPANIALTTSDTCARVQWAVPTALDNCRIASVIGTHQSGNCFKLGATTVSYAATDSAGNRGYCSFTVTVNSVCANDTIKPILSNCPRNIVINSADSCARAQWTAPLATDNCGLLSVIPSLQSGTCFKRGATTVTYTATDLKNNKATCFFTVTVVNPCANDTIKPTFFNCPQNIVVNSNDTCARAQWATPFATDNCGTPSVISSHISGFCFKAGTTTVDYTATDAKGNKAVCSFKVTVINPCANDIIKPTIYNCPTNIVKTTADTATIVTWRVPSAIDNCGTVTVAASHQSGARFKVGVTTVTYTAIDSKGNRSVCSFTITVNREITPCSKDTMPPVFRSCPSNISVSTASLSSIAQWNLPTATDNCSTPSVFSTFSSGSSFPIGTTVVTYTATDAARNASYCQFNVVVTKTPLVIDTAKCYVLVARSSKKALTIAGASLAPAADAVQWTYLNSLNQKWKITPADSNSVNLTVRHSGMNLDTRWGALTNGSKLMQYGRSTAATQKWQLILLNDGYYRVINKGSKLALSVSGGPNMQTNGRALVQLSYANLFSQQWSIESVSCTSVGTNANFASNDILEVDAKPEHNRARIEWADNTGYKNDYYEVEKLNEKSGNFEQLAIVNNKSFDNATTYQSIYDNAPNEGDNVYRVKVIYTDSSSKVSLPKHVSFNGLHTIKVYPNPASDYVDIDLTNFNNETVGVYLYNGFGQKVAFQNIEKGKASFVHFDISNQQSGSYLVRVTAQGKRDVLKQVQVTR